LPAPLQVLVDQVQADRGHQSTLKTRIIYTSDTPTPLQFLVDQVQQIGGTPESIGVPLPPPLPPTVR